MTSNLDRKTSRISHVLIASIGIIFTRLLYLQVHLGNYLWNKSRYNFTRVEKVLSPRGNIVDINGTLLATNRPVINLIWKGTGNRAFSSTQQKLIDYISSWEHLNIDAEKLSSSIKKTEKLKRELTIARDLDMQQLAELLELYPDNANISLEHTFERLYPYRTIASHIVGYLGFLDADTIGKMGLENKFNDTLKGEHGHIVSTVNSLGSRLGKQHVKQPCIGQTIRTTIDLTLQKIAENVFSPEQSGCLILIDQDDGAIKALVSRPHFDPSLFLKPISFDDWRELQEKRPFLNRAFSACYPPASLFKLVTLAAALETNLITPDTLTICKGSIRFGNSTIRCARRYGGHGILNVKESVAQSCNILFFEIGKRINIDVLTDYANRFGLGKKTGILFSEKSGLMPTRSWKEQILGESWWPGETLQAAIGQSYLLTTPIQCARMIGSIFTGYLVRPRIVLAEPIEKTPLNIHPQTRAFLQESMAAVVMEGTGKILRPLTYQDFSLYNKTGTAQTSHLSKRKQGDQYLEHAWAATYFQYKDQHPLTLIVLIEHAGRSRPAQICIKKFLLEYKKIM